MQAIENFIKDLLIPNQCIICHKINKVNLCSDCILLIPNKTNIWIHKNIIQSPIFTTKSNTIIQPLLDSGNLKSILACTDFNNPTIRKSIHYLKYKNLPQIAEPLANIMLRTMGQHLKQKDNLILCPIPLHKNRLNFRGYNQSDLLTKHIASKLKLEVYTSLERIRDTPHQMRISNRQNRIKNITDAFQANQAGHKDQTIIIIDDVTTTLSTISQAAKALHIQGFRDIHALILAH